MAAYRIWATLPVAYLGLIMGGVGRLVFCQDGLPER